MKSILIISILVGFVSCKAIDQQWHEFKLEHKKVYTLSSEDAYRKDLFVKSLKEVEEHNERFNAGLETYEKGINQFSDLTFKEFAASYLGGVPDPVVMMNDTDDLLKTPRAPDSHSWYDSSIPVKNQGVCGSCWAFAAVANVEYNYKIFQGRSYSLSEQELVDCETISYGCNFGWSSRALEYIRDRGISYGRDYPYRDNKGTCRSNSVARSPARLKSVRWSANSEASYKEHLYSWGPITVSYYIDNNFRQYKSGVFQSNTCNYGSETNHIVLVIGYGFENGRPYWLGRNSWGTGFGENGHFKILRNSQMCNFGKWSAYYAEVA